MIIWDGTPGRGGGAPPAPRPPAGESLSEPVAHIHIEDPAGLKDLLAGEGILRVEVVHITLVEEIVDPHAQIDPSQWRYARRRSTVA